MPRNALIARLERYTDLTIGERAAIQEAGTGQRRIALGERLIDENAPNEHLYIVEDGWLHASRDLVSGARQILRLHYPGDLVGTSSIAWARASTTLTALSAGLVTPVPKVALGQVFKAQPWLAALLYAVAAAEDVAMSDRLTSLGRTNAVERLATLLLDMLARLRMARDGTVDTIDLPLTQSEIGDALGLTSIHVNRTFRSMETRGMIVREGRRVRLPNEAALIAMVGFVDRYETVATDWLPAPEPVAA